MFQLKLEAIALRLEAIMTSPGCGELLAATQITPFHWPNSLSFVLSFVCLFVGPATLSQTLDISRLA